MRTSLGAALMSCALILSACSGVPVSNPSQTNQAQGVTLQGRVHGGQQPITNAHVYLYAANTTGYGNASVSLLKSTGSNTFSDGTNYYVKTDSNGNFTISGDYSCPSSTSQVYIYSIGGSPGATANPVAGLMAALGTCATPITTSFIFVDEVSTIATAYAIAGYTKDATDVSSSGSPLAITDIANAFATVTNLESLSTGTALATTPVANGGNGTVPQAEINTLADILAACINTNGSTASGMPCNTLFTNALSGGTSGTQPGDTATAAINIAHNPGANIANLLALSTPSAPFQPTFPVSPQPNDFTIAITYTGGGLNNPDGLAVDSSGNIWVANPSGGDISEFSPVGDPLSGSTGYTHGGLSTPSGVAIDGNGNVWVANENNSISKLNSTGGNISGSSGFTGACLTANGIADLAVDAAGNVWLSNLDTSTNVICKFNSNGTQVGGYTNTGLNVPTGLAVDIAGNLWVSGNPQTSVGSGISEFTPSGSSGTWSAGSPYTGAGLDQPQEINFDASGNLWVANSITPGVLSKFSSTGSPIGTGYTGGGLNDSIGLVIDGAGNVWLANSDFNCISEFNSNGTAISGPNGYTNSSVIGSSIIAIDGSGNVWVNDPAPSSTISEFVGAASPVVTPVVANLITPYGTHAVNKP